jgi:biopolymer transport protein ExbB
MNHQESRIPDDEMAHDEKIMNLPIANENRTRQTSVSMLPRVVLWLMVLLAMLAATQWRPALLPPVADAQEVPLPPGPSELTTSDATGGRAAAETTAVDPVRLAESRLNEADKSNPAAAGSKTVPQESINPLELLRQGGIELIAILIVSIISMAFAVERFLGLRRVKVVPRKLITGLKDLLVQPGGFDPRPAYKLCQQYPSTAANVVKATLLKLGRPNAELEHTVEEVSEREATRLYANVRWQNLAFNVAPMLGLLGTIRGMIIAFFVTSHLGPDVSKAERLATGIYAALVNTFAGLAVAIPAAILAHVLETRILKLMGELDELMQSMLPQLERFEGHVHVTDQHQAARVGEEPTSAVSADTQAKHPAVAPK